MQKIERDQSRDQASQKSRRIEEKNQKRQLKDGKKMNKILWIVIIPEECAFGDDDWDLDETEDHKS